MSVSYCAFNGMLLNAISKNLQHEYLYFVSIWLCSDTALEVYLVVNKAWYRALSRCLNLMYQTTDLLTELRRSLQNDRSCDLPSQSSVLIARGQAQPRRMAMDPPRGRGPQRPSRYSAFQPCRVRLGRLTIWSTGDLNDAYVQGKPSMQIPFQVITLPHSI